MIMASAAMAASLLRLGLRSGRHKCVRLNNNNTITLQGKFKLVKVGILCPTKSARFVANGVACIHTTSFKEASKKDEAWRREFLLKKLDKKKKEKVEVWRNMSVEELAKQVGRPTKDLLQILHLHIPEGHFYKSKKDLINNFDILRDTVRFMGKAPLLVPSKTQESTSHDLDVYPRPPADPKDLVKRSPIVTIMGHVDHGKTTLLDYLRKANVVAGEFGGITQHIGAFSVKLGENDKVTFIDTPGHAAFTSMRARGANATDIVVLVVAADDGVMEQTVESIRMAREAEAPIIVAINKIDKPSANIKRTEEMLAEHQIYTENMGGDIQAIPISALNGTNIETLVEAIILQSEIMGLQSDPGGLAEGVIVESSQDPNKGKLATAIVQRGTLRKGAILVAGTAYAKVRLMFDELGKQISKAPPSTPVEMMGWKELPAAGEILLEVESEKKAQQVVSYRKSKEIENKGIADQSVISEKQAEHKKAHNERRRRAAEQGLHFLKEKREKLWVEDTTPRVKVIIKGDVDGSVEAILDVLETYDNSDVPLDVVHFGVGELSPSDIEAALLFKAIIYCFNVKISPELKNEARKKGVSVRQMNVIYHLVDDIKKELAVKMPVEEEEQITGEADVIQQFDVTEKRKKFVVAGLRVTKGELSKSDRVKLVRGETILYDGTIASLRHLKNEVNSMKSGTECGLMLNDASIPVQLGDIIVCYKPLQVQKKVDWDPGF
ncbi:translation initiation factor IF-2, mitochondrial isoform X1 [Frankliniella occidentalis]|uniref:Translation initiation factor IF-2, mitochondrial n=2 Tax=Frankliniella occidentalis TaxID=133901 RepID=A0A6J1RXW5_FRAOC|nr:translation initiation factor IF-2, mitochondrial isoform X1 [Frankliniella occidentalis]